MRNTGNGQRILLAEDEAEVRSYLEMALKSQGYGVDVVQDGEEVLSYLRTESPVSAVLLDLIMPRKDGLETLREIRTFDRDLPVIMISGAATPLNVVNAMKNGATDFIAKPVNHEALISLMQATIGKGTPCEPVPLETVRLSGGRHAMFGSSPAMRELVSIVNQVGWSEAPVLIQGETGSGKEVLARHLHALSPRVNKTFLKLNCAALPSELVESELFGYERGAFTGAFQKKPGMFELADGGTLMLDEIGDMSYHLQAKLLQVLQDQEFQRLGGKEMVRVDVRVIAATHNDLEQSITDGKFRADLYYRLNVINLRVPPLRDRKDDIDHLAEFLLKKHATSNAPIPTITPALRRALSTYSWPGNVRELENFMRKLIVVGNADSIARELQAKTAREALSGSTVLNGGAPPSRSLPSTPILEQVTRAKHNAEREAILGALHSLQWNRKKAAALLKIDYKALLYKMKKLGIEDKIAILETQAQHGHEEEPRRAAAGGGGF
jgi:two-component system, NtrC family, response regulator AtoC